MRLRSKLRAQHATEPSAERHDHRRDLRALGPTLPARHFLAHDAIGVLRFTGTALTSLAHHSFEIVDVVEKDLALALDPRIDVARHREIDEEQASTPALLAQPVDELVLHHETRRARAGDHDVGFDQRRRQIAPTARLTVDRRRQHRDPGLVAPHDQQACAGVFQEFRYGLGHLAGAQQHHRAPGELAENLSREVHRHARHRDLPRPKLGFGAHALGCPDGPRHRAVQRAADGSSNSRGLEGFLHLPQDLRLTQH